MLMYNNRDFDIPYYRIGTIFFIQKKCPVGLHPHITVAKMLKPEWAILTKNLKKKHIIVSRLGHRKRKKVVRWKLLYDATEYTYEVSMHLD